MGGRSENTRSTADSYTRTPMIQSTLYVTSIRHCKHLLVVVYEFLSCSIAPTCTYC